MPDRPCGSVVTVDDATGRLGEPRRLWIARELGRALASLGAFGEVRIRVADDAEVAAAHQQYLGVAGTTDVITFDLADGAAARGGGLDVDLLLCLDEAERQARARGLSVERELLLYALHGVLHCLGEDDHDDAGYARMHAREDQILTGLGVGPTFASGDVAGPSSEADRA